MYAEQPYAQSGCNDAVVLTLTQSQTQRKLYKVLVIEDKFVNGIVSFMSDLSSRLQKSGWHVFRFSPDAKSRSLLDNLRDVSQIDRFPDILVLYNPTREYFKAWPELETYRAGIRMTWVDEAHEQRVIDGIKYSIDAGFDGIFARYPHAVSTVTRGNKTKCFPLHHAATENFVRPIDRTGKKERVLLSGVVDDHFYLFRKKAEGLMEQGAPIDRRNHPGYEPKTSPAEEASDYAAQISSYLIAISGGSLPPAVPAPFVLAKHFEIPAAGTALLTDEKLDPYLKELGFINGENYIATSADQMEQAIKFWLLPENRDKLLDITEKGQNLVLERHMNVMRAEAFDHTTVQFFHQKLEAAQAEQQQLK